MTSTIAEEGREEETVLLRRDRLGRVRMPKEKREALLDEFERSGVSGQQFAKWAGVSYPTFANWRQQRRKQRGGSGEGPPHLSVKLVEAVLPEQASLGASGTTVLIHLPGGMKVECSGVEQAAQFVRSMGVGRC